MNDSKPIYLLHSIPIELFGWKQRVIVVNSVVCALGILIDFYNKAFRLSHSIMKALSIFIVLLCYSIVPLLGFLVAIFGTCHMCDISTSELYELALRQSIIFVSFGMGLVMFYVTELLFVVWFDGNTVIDTIERYLIISMQHVFARCMCYIRTKAVEYYRETGWDVLQLIAKQQQEQRHALYKHADEYLPKDLIGVIDSFITDDELLTLSNARIQLTQSSEEKNMEELTKKAEKLKPCHIFKMYQSHTK